MLSQNNVSEEKRLSGKSSVFANRHRSQNFSYFKNDPVVVGFKKIWSKPISIVAKEFLSKSTSAEIELTIRCVELTSHDKQELTHFIENYFKDYLNKPLESCQLTARELTTLGLAYYKGILPKKDVVSSYALILTAHQLGDNFATYTLGLFYLRGHGVETNFKIAKHYFRQAYQAGSNIACAPLGFLATLSYKNKLALKYFLEGASSGDPICWKLLADDYPEQIDNSICQKQVVAYYKKAAVGGDVNALRSLIIILLPLKLTEKDANDVARTVYYLRLAVTFNHSWAYTELQDKFEKLKEKGITSQLLNNPFVAAIIYQYTICTYMIDELRIDEETLILFNQLRTQNDKLFYYLVSQSEDSLNSLSPLFIYNEEELYFTYLTLIQLDKLKLPFDLIALILCYQIHSRQLITDLAKITLVKNDKGIIDEKNFSEFSVSPSFFVRQNILNKRHPKDINPNLVTRNEEEAESVEPSLSVVRIGPA